MFNVCSPLKAVCAFLIPSKSKSKSLSKSAFIEVYKTMPSGHGQSSKALPFEQLIATSELRVVPTTPAKGDSNEPLQKIITHHLALPIPY
jgi:hypothetical protein